MRIISHFVLTCVGGADLGLRGGDAGHRQAVRRAHHRCSPVLTEEVQRSAETGLEIKSIKYEYNSMVVNFS